VPEYWGSRKGPRREFAAKCGSGIPLGMGAAVPTGEGGDAAKADAGRGAGVHRMVAGALSSVRRNAVAGTTTETGLCCGRAG